MSYQFSVVGINCRMRGLDEFAIIKFTKLNLSGIKLHFKNAGGSLPLRIFFPEIYLTY